jgi:hypothetical protein
VLLVVVVLAYWPRLAAWSSAEPQDVPAATVPVTTAPPPTDATVKTTRIPEKPAEARTPRPEPGRLVPDVSRSLEPCEHAPLR